MEAVKGLEDELVTLLGPWRYLLPRASSLRASGLREDEFRLAHRRAMVRLRMMLPESIQALGVAGLKHLEPDSSLKQFPTAYGSQLAGHPEELLIWLGRFSLDAIWSEGARRLMDDALSLRWGANYYPRAGSVLSLADILSGIGVKGIRRELAVLEFPYLSGDAARELASLEESSTPKIAEAAMEVGRWIQDGVITAKKAPEARETCLENRTSVARLLADIGPVQVTKPALIGALIGRLSDLRYDWADRGDAQAALATLGTALTQHPVMISRLVELLANSTAREHAAALLQGVGPAIGDHGDAIARLVEHLENGPTLDAVFRLLSGIGRRLAAHPDAVSRLVHLAAESNEPLRSRAVGLVANLGSEFVDLSRYPAGRRLSRGTAREFALCGWRESLGLPTAPVRISRTMTEHSLAAKAHEGWSFSWFGGVIRGELSEFHKNSYHFAITKPQGFELPRLEAGLWDGDLQVSERGELHFEPTEDGQEVAELMVEVAMSKFGSGVLEADLSIVEAPAG